MSEVKCFCGSPATLRSNSLLYNGKEYGNGKAYICTRFPNCRGSVGTHPDGRPLGIIADQETKDLRQQVHALIDPIWKDSGLEGKHKRGKRGAVYMWMADLLGVDEYHTGELTADQCRLALKRIQERPYSVHRAEIHAARVALGMSEITIVLPEQNLSGPAEGLVYLTEQLSKVTDTTAHGFLGGEFGYGSEYENDTFMMHPYCWCEESDCAWCEPDKDGNTAPNFVFKPNGAKVWWYKYIGRGMEFEKKLPKNWLTLCLNSLMHDPKAPDAKLNPTDIKED